MSHITIVLEVIDQEAFAIECIRMVHAMYDKSIENGARIVKIGIDDMAASLESTQAFLRDEGYSHKEIARAEEYLP